MKALHILILFLCLPVLSYSQEDILSSMQGLSDNGSLIFELEGYTIIVEKNETSLDEKGIKRIKKKYDIQDVVSEYKDTTRKWQNLVIEAKSHDKKIPEVVKSIMLSFARNG